MKLSGDTKATCDYTKSAFLSTNSSDRCSIQDWVKNYKGDPSLVWSSTTDPAMNPKPALLQDWWAKLGYGQTNPSASGYVGFHFQPMSFAPGTVPVASVFPFDSTSVFCWFLGNTYVSISNSVADRKAATSFSCSSTTSSHILYGYFWGKTRQTTSSSSMAAVGSGNFYRKMDGTDLDNLYAMTFLHQMEKIGNVNSIQKFLTALPSSCMGEPLKSGSRQYFQLTQMYSPCTPLPGCPGGTCSPISTAHFGKDLTNKELAIYLPAYPPGIGCNTCAQGSLPSGCTADSNGRVSGCPYNGTGGWGRTDLSCKQITCDNSQTLASPSSYYDCNTCTTCGVESCNLNSINVYGSGALSCSKDKYSACNFGNAAWSGNTQKTVMKVDMCNKDSKGSACNCGPTLDYGAGRGCTDSYCQNNCKFQSFYFTYECLTPACTEHSALPGNTNDLRDLLTVNNEFWAFSRNPTGKPYQSDPDGDGVVGISTEIYCYNERSKSYGSKISFTAPTAASCASTSSWTPLCGLTKFSGKYYGPRSSNDLTDPNPTTYCGCCGNGICESALGETCETCPYDCVRDGAICCGSVNDRCNSPVCTVKDSNQVNILSCSTSTCSGPTGCPSTYRNKDYCYTDSSRNLVRYVTKVVGMTTSTECMVVPLASATCKFEEEIPDTSEVFSYCSPPCPDGTECNKVTGQCITNCEVSCTAFSSTTRRPIHLAIVFDGSGSMDDYGTWERREPITSSKEGARALVDVMLNGTDWLGFVYFSDAAEELQGLTSNHALVKQAIDYNFALSFTNIPDGTVKGHNILKKARDDPRDFIEVMVVFSDGVANRDSTFRECYTYPTSQTQCTLDVRTQGDIVKNDGVVIYTMIANMEGMENNYPESAKLARESLIALASSPDKYYEAYSIDQIQSVFRQLATEIVSLPPPTIVCQEGTRPCSTINPSKCDDVKCGANRCCLPCPTLYHSSMDINGGCANVPGRECCNVNGKPYGAKPSADLCGCVDCPSETDGDPAKCMCGRSPSRLSSQCDSNYGAVLINDPTQTDPSKCLKYSVKLSRYNKYSCQCETCPPLTQPCASDEILFPPPYFYSGCDNSTLNKVTDWLEKNANNTSLCPKCYKCDTVPVFIPSTLQLYCSTPNATSKCECSKCAPPSTFNCPTYSPGQLFTDPAAYSRYISCIFNPLEPLCDASQGSQTIRNVTDLCKCSKCKCPKDYQLTDPVNGNACETLTDCVKCPGCNCDYTTQICTYNNAQGQEVLAQSCGRSDSCDCHCEDCVDHLPDDPTLNNPTECPYNTQYNWGYLTPCEIVRGNVPCHSCIADGHDCTAIGMAFNTSDIFGCSCIPCDESTWSTTPGVVPQKCTKPGQVLNAGDDTCSCDPCTKLTTCGNTCSQKLSQPDLCSCVPCNATNVADCWTGIVFDPASCPDYSVYDSSYVNTERCDRCKPCDETKCFWTGSTKCSWQVYDTTCTKVNRACPAGQRIDDRNGDGVLSILDADANGCPICADVDEACPSRTCPSRNLTLASNFVGTIATLSTPCGNCKNYTISNSSCPLWIPNERLHAVYVETPCDSELRCSYEDCLPCENCPGGFTGSGCAPGYEVLAGDNCKCQVCNAQCEAGYKQDPNDSCKCIPCKCSDCLFNLASMNSYCSILENGDITCNGCVDANSDGQCEEWVHCDADNLCGDVVSCEDCVDPEPANSTWTLPDRVRYGSVSTFFCDDDLDSNDEYCTQESGFCVETPCEPVCDECNYDYDTTPCDGCRQCPTFECANTETLKHPTDASGNECYCQGCEPCTCSAPGAGGDCEPVWVNGVPMYCNQSALCTGQTIPCDPCEQLNPDQQYHIHRTAAQFASQSGLDYCDEADICECEAVDCECNVQCTPLDYPESQGRPSEYCDPAALCNSTKTCGDCYWYFAEMGIDVDYKRYKPVPKEKRPDLNSQHECNGIEFCKCELEECTCGGDDLEADCVPYEADDERYYCATNETCDGTKLCDTCEVHMANHVPEEYELFDPLNEYWTRVEYASNETCNGLDYCNCEPTECQCKYPKEDGDDEEVSLILGR